MLTPKAMSNKLDLSTYEHDPFGMSQNGGNYLVKKFSDDITDYDAGANARYQHNSIRVNPQSGLSNIFNGTAQQVDYLLTRKPIVCHYDKIDLYMTIQNTGAAVATLLPSHFMIDFIEILVNGAQVELIYNHMLLYNELYLAEDDEHVFNNRARRLFNGGIQGTAYAGPGTLAVGASRSFFLEIPCVFSKTETFMPALESDVTFRIHYQATPLNSTSLATTVTLTNADILISGREYSQTVKDKLLARYKQIDHVCGYMQPLRANIANQTLNAAQKTPVKLTEFSGVLSSQVVVFLVPAGAAGIEGLFNFSGISLVELNRNGYTISTFQDPPSDWILQQMAELYNTTAVSSQNIYVITQSNTPVESANFAIQRGGVFLTPNDNLNIRPATTGAYDVYAICYRFCNVTVTKTGQFVMQYISS